jgi:hypothetical protein
MRLHDDNGRLNTVPIDIQCMTMSYLKLPHNQDPTLDHRAISELVHKKIYNEMNEQIQKDFSDKEISDALFQIGHIKASEA